MMKIINSVLFFLVIFGVPAAYFILPKQKISVDEKRKLAVIPKFDYKSYINGKWADSVDAFVDDHFPMRDQVISYATAVQTYKGFELAHAEKIVVVKKKHNDREQHSEVLDTGSLQYLNNFEEDYSGSMLIIDGCVYPMGGGSPAASKYFSRMVSEYAKELKGETRVFTAVAPLSSAFIPVEKYKKYNTQNKKTLLAIRDNLTDGAIFSDVFNELNLHSDQKLFFGTDHHWKPIGAYYGYVAFCKAAGFDAVPLENMEKRVKYNFLGTMYQHTQDPSVKAHPDTMEYWVPKVATTAERFREAGFDNPRKTKVFYKSSSGGNTYSTFLGGDEPLIHINTTIKNGKKAVVIKNSMGNAFAVFLVSHYEDIWVVDLRYSKHNVLDLVRKNKIDDMIFAVGMNAAMGRGAVNMMRNLGKQSGVYVPKPKVVQQPSDTTNTVKKTPTDSIP